MSLRAWLAGLIMLIGCAPSVPRPRVTRAELDAGVDLPPVTVFAADARGADRPAPAPAPPGDARPDAGTDFPGDIRGDIRSDPAGDLRTDARTDPVARDGGGGGDTGRDDGSETGSDGGLGAEDDAAPGDGPTGVTPGAGDLVIDELLINPAGTDTNREWIEVVNVSALTLDLHELHVADAASDVGVDAGLLAPGGLLVLGQSLDATRNGGAPISFSFGNAVSLNNGGDAISLCLGPCATGALLAQVVWTTDLGAAYDGHAAVVGPRPDLFCPADEPFGTAGSFGTPGAPNPPCGD